MPMKETLMKTMICCALGVMLARSAVAPAFAHPVGQNERQLRRGRQQQHDQISKTK